MSFYLSDKDYKEMIGIISGNTGGKKGNDTGGTYIDMPSASTEPKQQGIVADTVDAVQMGAWKGVSDIAHGLGALTGADWLHKVGEWAGEGADENLATMSDEMKAALNQNAFDGEGQGVRNVRWWAGNLGSLIGQNLDTVLTLGAGKAATFGVKQAGKMLLKKEAAEEVGKVAVEQAAKRGIPQKYWNMVGITATMSAMSGGSRYSQKRDDVMAMTNEQLSQIPQFSNAYYEIADSEEGKGKTVEQLYDLAKASFADKVGRDAALNPAAIATDLATNAVSGLGGGFWGLGSPAKTIKGGLLKGAMVEGGTEAIQGVAEQYALNKAEQDNYNPNKDLTEGMADNAINGVVLGGVFGAAMGGLDTYTDRRAFNNQKRTLLNHINTGNEAIDSQLKNYVDMLNQGAVDLGDLVSASRVQALNNAGIANAHVRQMEEDARAQQQANAQFESDFFGEEQTAHPSEPEFTIDPQMERAVYVAKAIEKFRKGDLSGANEFISDPMIFADNATKSQFVIDRGFGELKNIAEAYGLNPKDGKAMRQWIEDYIAKAREFNENNQQPTHESNLQFTANVAPENRSGVVSGANDEIDVGNGNYQPFQYEVVDATTLSPTQQKDDNQFRDRDRTASQSQINNIARNLDPRKLAASPTMDMGAPLLALDGKTIIAGNGRTMAIRQAYQEGGAAGYRQFLKDNAGHFGVDSVQLDAVENPVLVRRLTSPVDIAQVAINSNEQGGMRMSDLDQAQTQGNLSQASMFGEVVFDKLGSLQQAKNVDEDIRLSLNESANSDIQRTQEILRQTFGKAAEHIEVTTFANPPKDVKNLITSDVEGWFNPKTGKITIVADSIKPTKTMTKDERLQFVAWHEMGHRGINVGYKGAYDNLMAEVGKNKAVSQIADVIQIQRKGTDDLAATNRTVAIEEAIAEIMAANETGKWNELETRYGVEIKKDQRQSARSWLAMTAQRIKEFLSKIFGAERAAQFSDEDVLNLVAKIKESAVVESSKNGDVRFSRNEELTEERYNQAKENGETELTFHQWKQVRSPEFKAWFGDWENDPENASKVVNPKTGEPLVVYHGTNNDDFYSFERYHDGYDDAPSEAFFFTDDLETAEEYAGYNGRIIESFLDVKEPFSQFNESHVNELNSSIDDGEVNSPAYGETPPHFNTSENMWNTIADNSHRLAHNDILNGVLNWVADNGYDGVILSDSIRDAGESVSYAVFNPNQIKSATDNTGAFSKENDDIRFSRKAKSEYQRDLMVTHNISANGIMHAHKMGGLPLASVAVAKQSNPLTNFGEVTLIGSRDYIDPKGVNKAKVFGSDIYSPRYPRVTYEYSSKDQKALFNRFEKSAKEIGDSAFDYYFTQGLEDTGAKQAMLDSDAVKHQFLKEHNIPYEKAYRDIPKSVHADYPSIQKAIKAGISEEDISSIESADKFEGLFREFIKDYIKDIEGRVSPSPLLKNVIVRAKQALDGDKYAVRTFAETRVKEGLKLQESKKVLDQPETLSNMRKAVSKHEDAFRDYVDSIVETMPVKEKIWNGTDGHGRNKYVAHTIENVVKKLKKDLRGGESFNYGMPNVRAAVTPKFKSIADIQANKHRIVSKEEFETARDALEKEGDSLANKLGVGTLDIYDVLWNAIDENTSKAFSYAGIKDTQENRMAVDAFLNKLKALPTEYFEGKAKDITQFSNFAGAVVPDNLAKNAYDVLEKSGVKIFTYDSTNPKSRIEAIKQATNQLDEERGGDILFSRANTMQSALDLAMTGVADSEPGVWDNLKSKDFSGFKERFNRAMGKVDEWLADSLRPVNDWIDSMRLADQTGNTSSRDHEKRRLKDAMYTAKGKRDAMNSELEQAYLKPILSKIATLSKATKKGKNPIDELTMKRMVGNWISAKYSIEKNLDLLRTDEKVMRDAKQLLDNARQNGTDAEVRRLNDAYLKAKAQYDNRKADIYNTDYKNKGNRFKVGVAGGWSIPEAELIMKNTEQHISKSDLESVAEMVYDLNQARLEIDRASGRYTEKEYQEYKANRHYVPLTGDPNADVDTDIISGAGSSAVNIGRDKALKGRTSSEAEDAIDAMWKSVGKSTTYAGFAEFKGKIDDLYETEVTMLKEKGYSDSQAREQATANLGISKRKMQGLTRSSDNVLIRKEGGEYYEYELPSQAMEALRNDNVEHANAFLKLISKPTSWYARGVTQWTVTFAPMNMMRDTWEKSEFIRVQKLYDNNNRLVDSKTMDKIGRATIANAFADKEVWQATKRLGFGQELRDSVPAERMLKQLLKDGGVSNYGTYLDKSEVDLIKRLKKENNPIAGKLEKAGKILEGYNKMFDTVSALAAYKALVENGIDSKQAAATTLELTNFRKTGSKMRGIKALYMFSQPTVMGAANLIRYLSTRKGQIRFAAYLAVMTSLYTVLRSMDDDDEGGNKMDQLGDITRYIPIPIGGGHYFKIPVGFGMPQMAWNFSTNIVKGAVSDISLTEAGANMLAHSLKTFAPVSPSEISASKYPMEKITLTATPTILQPLMQNVLNRSAFGSKITTNYVREDKLKAEQSKATTAQFWKDTALFMNDNLGIDMHPEQIKNLFDGYSSMFGSLKELNTVLVENPNRETLGRNTRIPFLNQFIGTTNEFSIQSRYYEASGEAGNVAKEYESRKARGELGDWLDDDKRKLIKFHEEDASIVGKMRSEKAKLTRALRSGKISAVAYENGIKRYNKDMSRTQAQILRKYRLMEGLNTN